MPSHKGPDRPAEDPPTGARRQQDSAKTPAESPLDRARAATAKLRAASQHSHTPPDPGEVLAEAPRGEGHPFVTIAVWGADGWPVRGKQVSVRVGELGPVLEALILAAERASGWKP